MNLVRWQIVTAFDAYLPKGTKFELPDGRTFVADLADSVKAEHTPIEEADVTEKVGKNRHMIVKANNDLRAMQLALKKEGHLFNSQTGNDMDIAMIRAVNQAINVRCLFL